MQVLMLCLKSKVMDCLLLWMIYSIMMLMNSQWCFSQ